MYVENYVCMYHVCMTLYQYACMFARIMYLWVCVYIYIHECMYVCICGHLCSAFQACLRCICGRNACELLVIIRVSPSAEQP